MLNPTDGRDGGGPVTFFLDEMRVSPQEIASVPMPDIAIVKAHPHPTPFAGIPGGGAGLAIYTRFGYEQAGDVKESK